MTTTEHATYRELAARVEARGDHLLLYADGSEYAKDMRVIYPGELTVLAIKPPNGSITCRHILASGETLADAAATLLRRYA